jgi:hypothetical protein
VVGIDMIRNNRIGDSAYTVSPENVFKGEPKITLSRKKTNLYSLTSSVNTKYSFIWIHWQERLLKPTNPIFGEGVLSTKFANMCKHWKYSMILHKIINNCNMETPRKPLNKYWCSVPHYLSDIRNIYIKADRFPLIMLCSYSWIWLFRIISIPSIFFYFRPPDHVISMD